MNILKVASYHTNYLTRGQVFRAALPILREETSPGGNQSENITKDLMDKWWCLIGKGHSCILEAHKPFKTEHFILFFYLGKKVFVRYSNGKKCQD